MSNTGQQTLERPDPAGENAAGNTARTTGRRAPLSRRGLLTGIASSVAVAACADIGSLDPSLLDPAAGDGATPAPSEGATGSETPSAPPAPSTPPPGAPVEPVLADDQVLHLLRRATFGPTNAMVARVQDAGVAAWLDEQLAPDSIDDSACDQRLGRFSMLDKTARQIQDTERDQGGQQRADERLVEATVVRALSTERQLYEVMVEFWANHFSIHTPSGDQWGRRTVADREVYRPNALGRFADLLVASAKDPAMLSYLNNEDSCYEGDEATVQENYGRELLELHTVSVDGGYTEEDVKNSAFILTGWTVDGDKVFRYDAGCHFVGAVQVLDFSHPNDSADGGLAVGEAYLDHLAHHPATATYLATKLARRFVADEPPASLVDTLAAIYLDNDTAIVPVLRALFASDEFAGSIGQKTRRPLEDIVASARALSLAPRVQPNGDRPRSPVDVAYDLGHAPLNWGPPDGYPDVAAPWLSSARLLGSWNYHWDLLEGRYDDWLEAAGDAVEQLIDTADIATAGALVDALTTRLLWQEVRPEDRALLLEFAGLADGDPIPDGQLADLRVRIALAILNSPYHLQR